MPSLQEISDLLDTKLEPTHKQLESTHKQLEAIQKQLEPIHKKLETLDELVIKVDKILAFVAVGNEDLNKKLPKLKKVSH